MWCTVHFEDNFLIPYRFLASAIDNLSFIFLLAELKNCKWILVFHHIQVAAQLCLMNVELESTTFLLLLFLFLNLFSVCFRISCIFRLLWFRWWIGFYRLVFSAKKSILWRWSLFLLLLHLLLCRILLNNVENCCKLVLQTVNLVLSSLWSLNLT